MGDSVDRVRRPRGPTRGTGARRAEGEPGKAEGADRPAEPQAREFGSVLESVSAGPAKKRLGSLLEDIRRLAEILSRRRLLEDLESYREKVGEFLRVYLDEVLQVREAAGQRGSLRRKQMIVVKRVNVELDELSRMVLGGAEAFKILKELGTIEGLLMDLYR
jgi:uncharacterized protein YaaR (DUF327 family)